MDNTFFKIVCEQISPFAKEIIVDENCKDINDVCKVLLSHPELMEQNKTWLLYPMSVHMN